MRPLYFDLTGNTDANGNASIALKLPQTGEWHNVKVAIGTTGAGEWAILVNGRPYTYGRGRRVTLGPELIQDSQTVTVTLSGGPPTAAIDGTVTGKSGTPDEITAGFHPQPNTIALDTSSVPTLLVTTPAGNGTLPAPITVQLPVGATAVGYACRGTAGSATAISIGGTQSTDLYALDTANFAVVPFAVLLNPVDTSVTVNVQAAGPGRPTVDFFVWVVPTAVWVQNRAQTPLFVQQPPGGIIAVTEQFATPALWQAPRGAPAFGVQAGIGTTVLVAAVAGQSVYVFGGVMDIPVGAGAGIAALQDTGGTNYAQFDASTVRGGLSFQFNGAKLPVNLGLQLVVAGAAATARCGVAVNQG